ncbi:hypothetical protein HDV02_006404, partial [Globomyces sp. JEL0801]
IETSQLALTRLLRQVSIKQTDFQNMPLNMYYSTILYAALQLYVANALPQVNVNNAPAIPVALNATVNGTAPDTGNNAGANNNSTIPIVNNNGTEIGLPNNGTAGQQAGNNGVALPQADNKPVVKAEPAKNATVASAETSELPNGISKIQQSPTTDYCRQFLNGRVVEANGTQLKTGGQSCSSTPIGQIPTINNMVSTLIVQPAYGAALDATLNNTVVLNTKNLDSGFFNSNLIPSL